MLAITLSSLLLASAALPEALLTLEPRTANQLELTLCFRGAGRNVRFELEVENASKAGLSRSRQAGEVAISVETVCPLRNRLGLAADAQVTAHLRWWLDGEEQSVIQRFYP
ncbi:MAG: hypothetical protein ACOH2I_08945 [Pseudomonas sp.]